MRVRSRANEKIQREEGSTIAAECLEGSKDQMKGGYGTLVDCATKPVRAKNAICVNADILDDLRLLSLFLQHPAIRA
jgi:hypothetical protein